jgi:hypothetical protein
MAAGSTPGPVKVASGSLPPRTPGPLGCRDAADPNCPAHPGNTPGPVGINDGAAFSVDPTGFVEAIDFFKDYHVTPNQVAQAAVLDGCTVRIPWSRKKDGKAEKGTLLVWKVGGAVVYRLNDIKEDLDGAPRTYHPPTEVYFDGKGPGLGRDSLLNAAGNWEVLVSGCELLRAFYHAKKLSESKDPAAKAALDAILQKQKLASLKDFEAKTKGALCVRYIDGRPREESRKDWKRAKWVGVQTDAKGEPKVRVGGPYQGFYIPAIVPGWADADKHPWLVKNPLLEKHLGTNLGNGVAVVANGQAPKTAFGMLGDSGPIWGLGECSTRLIQDLAAPDGCHDFIYVQFPAKQNTTEKSAENIRREAEKRFNSWFFAGRKGIEVVKYLFPTAAEYARMLALHHRAISYLHKPGAFPPLRP